MNLKKFLNMYKGRIFKILLYDESEEHICDFYDNSLGITSYESYEVVNFSVVCLKGSMPVISVCVNIRYKESEK